MSLANDLSYSMKWDLSASSSFSELDANKVIRRGLFFMGTGPLKI